MPNVHSFNWISLIVFINLITSYTVLTSPTQHTGNCSHAGVDMLLASQFLMPHFTEHQHCSEHHHWPVVAGAHATIGKGAGKHIAIFFSWFHKWNELDVVHAASPHGTIFTLYVIHCTQRGRASFVSSLGSILSLWSLTKSLTDFLRLHRIQDFH